MGELEDLSLKGKIARPVEWWSPRHLISSSLISSFTKLWGCVNESSGALAGLTFYQSRPSGSSNCDHLLLFHSEQAGESYKIFHPTDLTRFNHRTSKDSVR